MAYFPHPDLFFAAMRIRPEDCVSGTSVRIDGGVLRKLVSMALASAGFDEAAYLRYPDIEKAHADDQIDDLAEHYQGAGFFEGRFAPDPDFDPEWYVQQYYDVRLALESGEVESAKQHYLESGAKEWRSPSAEALAEVADWMSRLQR